MVGQGFTRPRRALVLRFGAIGDVFLATPVVRCLQAAYPELIIDFVVKDQFASIVRYHPEINQVWTLPDHAAFGDLKALSAQLNQIGYDWIIDLQSGWKSFILCLLVHGARIDRFSPERFKRFLLVHFRINFYGHVRSVIEKYFRGIRSWKIQDDGKGPEFFIDKVSQHKTDDWLKQHDVRLDKRIAVIAPGAGRATKRWLPEGFASVGDWLEERGYQIVLTGSESEKGICASVASKMIRPKVDACGVFSIIETGAMLDKAEIVITNDTGLMHMASALNKKIVAIFGPTTREFGFFPLRAEARVVESPVGCRPCSYHGSETCPKKHFRCMQEISPDQVIKAVQQLEG